MSTLTPEDGPTLEQTREALLALPVFERWKILGPLWREYCRENAHQRVWLYAIQIGTDGPIKLGISERPHERLRTLQQACPWKLVPRACWRGFPWQEKDLHDEYAHARMEGEWFQPVPELLEYVDQEGDDFQDWGRRR